MPKPTRTTSPSTRRRVRWGWLVTTLALGLALIGTSWANHHSAVAAAATLDRGQAEILERATHEALRGEDSTTLRQQLETLLAEREAEGLRFVAVYDADGRLLASVGQSAAPIEPPRRGPPPETQAPDAGERPRFDFDLAHVGSRLRVQTPHRAGPPPDATRGRGRVRPRFQWLVIEFEPVVATQLAARSLRALVLGAIGAAVLMLAAWVFWRTSYRYEEAERRLEQQRRLTILGEMSAVLAHEIRNPLASLKGHAQLLAERMPEDTPDGRRAHRIVKEAARLEALTTDLLDFARSGPLDLKPVDPAELVRDAAADAAPGATIDDVAAPATWPLDAARFRQVMVNLLQNAAQAAPDAEPPTATVARENGTLVVAVRDRGAGIAEGQEARIFDPFFTTRTNGTGLGLPVARRIVELHGGTLTASNAPGGGAVFTVTVPEDGGAAWRTS